ncbi:hypothetical protein MLD38_007276 [Melastoma candidum]|uniref:Uncharacterized protein n=1 Tax=Melastoma candidum TaxID=119954 RepID=A0ACB9RRY4_9MYRT|nr:hypothetical protein MLD38_007276 [Melastoma candidum]
MRVPNTNSVIQQQHPQLIKPPSSASFCYEPTSVLDLRSPLSSSSDNPLPPPPPPPLPHPVAAPDDASTAPSHLDDPLLPGLDWDSIMNDIGFNDDQPNPVLVKSASVDSPDFRNPPPAPHSIYEQGHLVVPPDFEVYSAQGFPHPPLTSHHYTGAGGGGYGEADGGFSSGGFEVLEDLIRVSDCIDSNDVQRAQAILARLNQSLRSPLSGKPVHRAAFYFQEALNSLLLAPPLNRPNPARFSSWAEIVQNIRANKAFSGISPVAMFTHFTTNQALLESIDGLPTGWTGIFHVIDFDIGFGGQYASFLKEISERSEACNFPMPFVRVTAVVTEEYAVEARLIKENLTQYANEVKVRVSIDFVLVQTFEMTSFKAIKFMDGEAIAIHLSPTIFGRLGSSNNIVRFMNDVRRVSPMAVVFVDSEPWVGTQGVGAASFRTNFENCLEYYATLFESIDAAVGCGEDGNDWARKIEVCLMQPRIAAAVEWAGRRAVPPWREVFHGAGLRGVRMSQFADFQAEMLLGKVQVRGFHVAKRQGELVLCWRDRPLVATSAWRF